MPVGVIVGVLVPSLEEARVVFGVSAVLSKIRKALVSSDSSDAVAFVKQAESSVDHVLAGEVRRVGGGEEVLGKAALRTTKGTDFTGAPRLSGEPLAGIVTVLRFAPAQSEVAISNVRSFTLLSASKVNHGDGEPFSGEISGSFAGSCAGQVGVALLKDGGERFLGCGAVQVGGEVGSVRHWNPDMFLSDVLQIEGREGFGGWGGCVGGECCEG